MMKMDGFWGSVLVGAMVLFGDVGNLSGSDEAEESMVLELSGQGGTEIVSAADWVAHRDEVMERLRREVFVDWPQEDGAPECVEEFAEARDGVFFQRYRLASEDGVMLPLYLAHREGVSPADLDLVVLNVLDEEGWQDFLSGVGAAFPEAFPGVILPDLDEERFGSEAAMHRNMKWGMAYFPPRGIGVAAGEDGGEFSEGMLDRMRIWDIRRGMQGLRSIEGMGEPRLWLQSGGAMGVNALYASLFEDDLYRIDLHELPVGDGDGEGVSRVLPAGLGIADVAGIAGLAAERAQLVLYTARPEAWAGVVSLAERMGWEKGVRLRELVE